MIDVDGVSVLGKIVETKAKKNEALQISTYVTKPVAVIEEYYSILFKISDFRTFNMR